MDNITPFSRYHDQHNTKHPVQAEAFPETCPVLPEAGSYFTPLIQQGPNPTPLCP